MRDLTIAPPGHVADVASLERVSEVKVAPPTVIAPLLEPAKAPRSVPGSKQASIFICVFTIAALVFPADMVIKVVGADGFAAGLIALVLVAVWILTVVFGYHDPLHNRHPTRAVLALMFISALLSFVAMPLYAPDDIQRLSAIRWLMLWSGTAGVILITAEHIRTPHDIIRVVRALVWGGTFSAVMATIQFFTHWDPTGIIRAVQIGFTQNSVPDSFDPRGALSRVNGTSEHPIEMGVVAGMILPLAFWLLIYDKERKFSRRLIPVAFIGLAIVMSVSRSGVLAAGVSVGIFLISIPPKQRMIFFKFVPFAAVAVFAATPGYIRTITDFFGAGTADPSIQNRLNNYPIVLADIRSAPFLGRGGGTFIQVDLTKVLDNQYLMSSVELGLFGLVATILFFLVPPLTAFNSRRQSTDEVFRSLCAALTGGTLAAAVSGYTFDAFSFSQFTCVDAVVVGLCGACWLYAKRQPREFSVAARRSNPDASLTDDTAVSPWFRSE